MNILSQTKTGYICIFPDSALPISNADLYFTRNVVLPLDTNKVQELCKLIASLKTLSAKINGVYFSITHIIQSDFKASIIRMSTQHGDLEFDTESLLTQLSPDHVFTFLSNLKELNAIKPW